MTFRLIMFLAALILIAYSQAVLQSTIFTGRHGSCLKPRKEEVIKEWA